MQKVTAAGGTDLHDSRRPQFDFGVSIREISIFSCQRNMYILCGVVKNMGASRPRTKREVLRAAIAQVEQHTPPGWSLSKAPQRIASRADMTIQMQAPDGSQAVYIVEAKTTLNARDVPLVREQLAHWAAEAPGTHGMVVSRYLPASVRERLAAADLSYADATGNVLLRAERPGLHMANRGADRDPWRGPGRPKGTLKGAPAAKVVRALVDESRSWKMTDLVSSSRASTGSVYRVVGYLESEGLAVRDLSGRVTTPDWVALLRKWSEDYHFTRTNTVSQWIAPRGLDHLVSQMREGSERSYAVTGTIAARAYAEYAPARTAMVYAADPQRAAKSWGLRETDSGVNVLLAEPAFPFLLDRRADLSSGIRAVGPAQVAVDLMTGPGRSPAEAEELIDWMTSHEQSWRARPH